MKTSREDNTHSSCHYLRPLCFNSVVFSSCSIILCWSETLRSVRSLADVYIFVYLLCKGGVIEGNQEKFTGGAKVIESSFRVIFPVIVKRKYRTRQRVLVRASKRDEGSRI